MSIYEEEDDYFTNVTPKRGAGEIQLKLSYFTSNALSLIGKPTPAIHYSFAKGKIASGELEQLKDYEKKVLADIKKLDHAKNETLLIKRLKDESLLLKYSGNLPNDNDFASKLSTLVDEDFCDLTLVKRDGKVANLGLARTEKLSTI